ncbi:hypothetical protein W02_06890 [Nitrospira sp. KM1]|uniref:VPLPA-CTERM-specific exosortase XrtD n=1 Tax=Nitrospira sp. KM1 TaxID=1936990 RepID=UPI0013A7AC96|nr:VPLPA-CTERM-specific exosortase XrtD [Nitrospira sp. KM1]BCA53549.1 hypothetical protein W02_06890 [Nitrospira sp. KM1]
MSGKLALASSLFFLIGILGYLFSDSLRVLFTYWTESEDYSHGLFVPFISLFLAWQARHRIAAVGIRSSWYGPAIIAIGLAFYWVGELAALYAFQHLALWVIIVGVVVSLIGLRAAREVTFPLLYLLTSIPLPVFLYAGLSSRLQLWSSALGVGCLQFVGVIAFREGNVIDLGPVQLQVVEACSGIRYMLPLLSLALLCAYLFKDRLWKRVILVVSSVPISILVNGFRIGMIGVMVEWHGQSAAEGFYHLFEGWVLFMASLGLLILEMWILTIVDPVGTGRSLSDRFSWIDRSPVRMGSPLPSSHSRMGQRSLSTTPAYLCSVALLVPAAVASVFIGERVEVAPERRMFIDFPMHLDEWTGTPQLLEKQYIDALHFDDYVLAEYISNDGYPISLYSAYYRSQRKGQSAHSPQSCLPGGGWEIESLKTMDVPLYHGFPQPMHMNRALIKKDNQRQVVLYWFKQRDRILASEYLVKFYLLWDSLSRSRTDGALVRIASLVGPGESEENVNRRLEKFVSTVVPELNRYVPD